LLLIAFSIKAGLFPLFFWLPASYHTPPAAIGAAFAGLLTKVGVYALIRVFTLLFHSVPPKLFALLLMMSAATMVIGLVAALNERDFRRVLSFNLVGHIGYTTASLSLLTPAALAGAIFYVLHHIVVSLAGVPPLSGFLGKLAILEGTFAAGAYWVGALVLVVGLLTLLSMARTWADSFWRSAGEAKDLAAPATPFLVAIAALSLVTMAMTIGAESLFEFTSRAAHQLLQRDEYVHAVLGGTP
jgi:multicomponent Na+:H+ antiporter subunit D